MKADVKKYLEFKFDILKTLKESDKSEIFLAQDKATKKLVVIKILKSIGLPYKRLKKISHILWAKILYCAEDSADTVVVEEFLQGESLLDRLAQKKFLSADETRNILIQLCDGLKILHENKIIHRDIKPSNLILQAGGIIRLIDFDAARIYDAEKSKDTHFLGTKGYAPPEQFGYGQTDSRSDIYSIGVTFFEMLGGNCDSSLKKILSKCIELDPKNRWQSVDELKAALTEKPARNYKKYAKILVGVVLISAGILFFTNSTQDKNIPAPIEKPAEIVRDEKPATRKDKKVEEKPAVKPYQFPEIKMPIQNNSPVQNLPAQNLPPVENIPPPAHENEELRINNEEFKDYVKVKYWMDGQRSAAWTDKFERDITNAVHAFDISENLWSKWQSAGSGAIFFPDAELYIEAENFSPAVFTNPQVKLVYNDNGRIETKTFYGESIAPGEKISFKILLDNFRIDNPMAANGNWQSLNNFEVYFSGTGAKIIGSKMNYSFAFISQERWDKQR